MSSVKIFLDFELAIALLYASCSFIYLEIPLLLISDQIGEELERNWIMLEACIEPKGFYLCNVQTGYPTFLCTFLGDG